MRGLDPIRANLSCLASSSCAGLTRASIFFARKFLRRSMDCRVKPGNDDLKLARMGLDPRIHLLAKRMDCRVKPGNDNRLKLQDHTGGSRFLVIRFRSDRSVATSS